MTTAQTAYMAYGNWLGWKNPQGHTLPAWDQLPTQIKNAWTAAVETVAVGLRSEGSQK